MKKGISHSNHMAKAVMHTKHAAMHAGKAEQHMKMAKKMAPSHTKSEHGIKLVMGGKK